jgi:hypothetical protein
LASLRIVKGKTVLNEALSGVHWTAMPPLSPEQKSDLEERAKRLIASNDLVELPGYEPLKTAGGAIMWQTIVWSAQSASHVGPFLRRSLRSRRGVAGLVGVCLLLRMVYSKLGVRETVEYYFAQVMGKWSNTMAWIRELDDEWASWVLWGEAWWDFIQKWNLLQQGILGLCITILLCYGYCGSEEDRSSQASSKSGASSQSGESRTAEVKNASTMLLVQNQQSLQDLLEAQKAMAAELADYRIAQRAAEFTAMARKENAKMSSAQANPDLNHLALLKMAERLDGFESLVRQKAGLPAPTGPTAQQELSKFHQESSSSAAEAPLQVLDGVPAPVTPLRTESAPPAGGREPLSGGKETQSRENLKRARSPEPHANPTIDKVIRRIRDKTMLPQQMFLEQVEQWKEVDKEEWNRHFPEFYRERVAAESLAEIYSHGMTAEQWARQFVREHKLDDCLAAKDIISLLHSIDTMIMVDKDEGFLNKVGTEWLVRKAMGLIRAFENCWSVSDWSRPKGKEGNSWKSKVDWEAARRMDPQLYKPGQTISVPAVDDEIRRGMSMDAEILKARQKLLEAGGGKWEPGGV